MSFSLRGSNNPNLIVSSATVSEQTSLSTNNKLRKLSEEGNLDDDLQPRPNKASRLEQETDISNSIVLPLPVAGLMSGADGFEVAAQYTEVDLASKALGSKLEAPFMTLSFMALLVIPHLKLSDKGLFNGDDFNFDIF
jgi:hypothetical protein